MHLKTDKVEVFSSHSNDWLEILEMKQHRSALPRRALEIVLSCKLSSILPVIHMFAISEGVSEWTQD